VLLMRAFDQLRPIVCDGMDRLERLGLGQRSRVSSSRDKFVLDPGHERAHLLTSRPDADGFIRADEGSLLFRDASDELRSAIPRQLVGRAMQSSSKGLEFRWTQLGPADVRLLFAIVEWLATSHVPRS
jgi:hypothetical protein